MLGRQVTGCEPRESCFTDWPHPPNTTLVKARKGSPVRFSPMRHGGAQGVVPHNSVQSNSIRDMEIRNFVLRVFRTLVAASAWASAIELQGQARTDESGGFFDSSDGNRCLYSISRAWGCQRLNVESNENWRLQTSVRLRLTQGEREPPVAIDVDHGPLFTP